MSFREGFGGPFPGSPQRVVCCAISRVREQTPVRLEALRRVGVDFFQLRDREVSDREFETFLERLSAEAPGVLRRVLVNDRLALAASFPVAGVHLPEDGLPIASVRSRFLRGGLLLGRSVHGVEGACAAARAGADYLILGPVAATGNKSPLLPGTFGEACRRVRIPVWVVGGLTPRNLEPLAGIGISGIAAIRAFRDPEAAEALLEARNASFPRGKLRAPRTSGGYTR